MPELDEQMSSTTTRADLPEVVCADVDGTVLRTDLLFESLLVRLKSNPFAVFLIPFMLLRGRAALKRWLADRHKLSVDHLPLNEPVVVYLRERAGDGARVYLASASDRQLVERLADRIGGLAGVLASDGAVNLKGRAKADRLVAEFGDGAFEYLGDSPADFPVWERAGKVTVVSPRRSFIAKVTSRFPTARVFELPPLTIRGWVKALRIYQWMKNLLVFVPLMLAHRVFDVEAWLLAVTAFVSFSLCASGVYLLNDLLDLEADRIHVRKRKRPCAAGLLPLQYALCAAPMLFAAGAGLAMCTSHGFLVVLFLYALLTTLYSFVFKQVAVVDIILLAILYTIRIIGGGVATDIHVSQWLLGLSMFLFLSLACVKRFSELLLLASNNEKVTRGRGYTVDDMEQVAMFGSASAYISVLVLALYVSSREVVDLYKTPQVIWLACPLLLYWISRVWLLARRGLVHDDPLVFTLRDRLTYVIGFLAALIFIGAKW